MGVVLRIVPNAETGGTRVAGEVTLTPKVRGVPLPRAPLRALVRRRFRAERRRDEQFLDQLVAPDAFAVAAATSPRS